MVKKIIIKPLKIRRDKKSWNQLDEYEIKKLKRFLRSIKMNITNVWRIIGKSYSHNYNYDRIVTITFETMSFGVYQVQINLKTGEFEEV